MNATLLLLGRYPFYVMANSILHAVLTTLDILLSLFVNIVIMHIYWQRSVPLHLSWMGSGVWTRTGCFQYIIVKNLTAWFIYFVRRDEDVCVTCILNSTLWYILVPYRSWAFWIENYFLKVEYVVILISIPTFMYCTSIVSTLNIKPSKIKKLFFAALKILQY